MPTFSPRVHVTLSPSLDALLGRLATLQRVSKSNVLRELLETAAPALERSVALMEAAARSKPEALRGLARSLERAQDRIEGVLEGTLAALEDGPDLVTKAEAVKGRRPRRAAAGAAALPNPPTSNRGVKSTNRAGGKGGRHAI